MMDGDRDNGYHSNDKDVEMGEEFGDEQSHVFDDLICNDEILLDEPDYESARAERFQRNIGLMKNFNLHIAKSMSEEGPQEPTSYEDEAAIIIQKRVRGFLAQRRYLQLLLEQFEKEEGLRREKTMEQVEEAGLLLENHNLEVQFEDYNVVRKNRVQRLICHVITIQRAWRKFCAAREREQRGMEFSIVAGDSADFNKYLEAAASDFVNEVLAKAVQSLSFTV